MSEDTVARSDYMFAAGHTANFCPFSVEIFSKEENSARFVHLTLTTLNYKKGRLANEMFKKFNSPLFHSLTIRLNFYNCHISKEIQKIFCFKFSSAILLPLFGKKRPNFANQLIRLPPHFFGRILSCWHKFLPPGNSA
jgi:hypothetical protein